MNAELALEMEKINYIFLCILKSPGGGAHNSKFVEDEAALLNGMAPFAEEMPLLVLVVADDRIVVRPLAFVIFGDPPEGLLISERESEEPEEEERWHWHPPMPLPMLAESAMIVEEGHFLTMSWPSCCCWSWSCSFWLLQQKEDKWN